MWPSLTRRDLLWVRWRRLASVASPVWDGPPPLSETFALPGDRARFVAAAEADPALRWVQRPGDSSAPDVRIDLVDPHRADRRSGWIVQPVRDESDDIDVVIRIASLVPLQTELAQDAPWQTLGEGVRQALRRAIVGVLVACRDDLVADTAASIAGAPPPPVTVGVRLGASDTVVVGFHEIGLDEVTSTDAWEPLYPALDTADLRFLLTTPRPADDPDGIPVRYVPAPSVSAFRVDDAAVLHHAVTGGVYPLNATASYLWAAVTDGLTGDEIVGEVVGAYAFDRETVSREVWSQLAEWAGAGLVRHAGAPAIDGPERVAPSVAPVRPTAGSTRQYGTDDTVVAVTGQVEELDWLEPALGGWRRHRPAAVVGEIVIVQGSHGWIVSSSDGSTERCRALQQLGPVVRNMCLSLVSATSPVMITATTLGFRDHAVVVLGPPQHRRALVRATVDRGGTPVTLDVASLSNDPAGDAAVRGDALALQRPGATWLWKEDIEERPGHPDQLGWTLGGEFQRYWRPDRPVPAGVWTVHALIVDLGAVVAEEAPGSDAQMVAARQSTDDTSSVTGPDETTVTAGEGLTVLEALTAVLVHRSGAFAPFDATHVDALIAWLGRVELLAWEWNDADGFVQRARGLLAG